MLDLDFYNDLVNHVNLDVIPDFEKEMLWCVTKVRAYTYVLFHDIGLLDPRQPIKPFAEVENDVINIVHNFLVVVAQHPARIEYAPNKVETPRNNILEGMITVFDQLKSDDNFMQSVLELVRIVGVNEDSSHDRIGYATLVSIVLKIVGWLYPDVDLGAWLKQHFGE